MRHQRQTKHSGMSSQAASEETHPAFQLALQQEPALRAEFSTLRQRCDDSGRGARFNAFQNLIAAGRVAVNMSLSTCALFLDGHEYLNVFELVQKEVNAEDVDNRLRARLGRFYEARMALEQIFSFRNAAHYAALNVGGDGPDYYGACCVFLNDARWQADSTCFAGDSITKVFREEGQLCMDERQLLSGFATSGNIAALASVHNHDLIESDTDEGLLDRQAIQAALSAKDTLVEVHVFGKILASDVSRIRIQNDVCRDLDRKRRLYDLAGRQAQGAMQFDDLRAYRRVLELARQSGIDVERGT